MIELVQAAAVRCGNLDGETRCPTTFLTEQLTPSVVLELAAQRGWDIAGVDEPGAPDLCPRHRGGAGS